jgi:Zn-dependent protease
MIFNLFELVDVVIMTAVIGYLFHDTFRHPQKRGDILDQYQTPRRMGGVEWQDFAWAAMLVAPTIVLHELGHKFVAMGFGFDATFHAACSSASLFSGGFLDFYCGLTIVTVILKTVGVGFLFFVPAFVSVGGGPSNLQSALIAVAGPMVHLVFWITAAYLLKSKRFMKRLDYKKRVYLFFFKQINMFLFILNMIPIPGFDGFNFLYHLVKVFIG